jgi:hypothetical protein
LIGYFEAGFTHIGRQSYRNRCLYRIKENRGFAKVLVLGFGTRAGIFQGASGGSFIQRSDADAVAIKVVPGCYIPRQHNGVFFRGMAKRKGFIHLEELVALAPKKGVVATKCPRCVRCCK